MAQLDTAEFTRYLRIDKQALDDEIVQQPGLFYRVCEAYVEAAAERDAAKEHLAMVDAGLDGEARHRAEVDGEKITEGAIRGKVVLHKKHEAAFNAYVTAKTRADKLEAMKDSFKQRSFMLRDLAQLYVANYYESNSVQGIDRNDTAVYKKHRERLAEGRKR